MYTRKTALVLASALLLGTAPAQSLSTLFAGGNSLNSPCSNQFDVTVLNPGGVVITSLDINCENSRNGPVNSAFELEIYMTVRGSTYVGNQTTASAWHLISKGSGVSRAMGTPTPVDIDDIFVPPGTFGIAVQYVIPTNGVGTAVSYTNGNGSNQSYTNADLKIDLGAACTGLFAGPVYSPRVWNGTVHYEAAKTAAFGVHGIGCDGGAPTGIPTLRGGSNNPVPKLGGNFDVEIGNLAALPNSAFLVIGVSSFTNWGPLTLPADLGIIGLPGCKTYVPPDFLVPFTHIANPHTITIPIPNTPSAAGGAFGMQAVIIDPAASTGATVTNLGGGRVGT